MKSTRARLNLDERIAAKLRALSPTERRIASFMREHPEDTAFFAMTDLASRLATSDASIVRTAQSLGYAGFSDLKRELISGLRMRSSQGRRTPSGTDELVKQPEGLLQETIAEQIDLLEQTSRANDPEKFDKAVDILNAADRILAIGGGPSGHLTEAFVTRVLRIGHDAIAIGRTGRAFADSLLRMRAGDALVALVYEPVYREAVVALDEAQRQRIPVVLVTDNLAGLLANRVAVTLPARRGLGQQFKSLTTTGVILDALVLGIASRDKSRSARSLEEFERLRAEVTGVEDERNATRRETRSGGVR